MINSGILSRLLLTRSKSGIPQPHAATSSPRANCWESQDPAYMLDCMEMAGTQILHILMNYHIIILCVSYFEVSRCYSRSLNAYRTTSSRTYSLSHNMILNFKPSYFVLISSDRKLKYKPSSLSHFLIIKTVRVTVVYDKREKAKYR